MFKSTTTNYYSILMIYIKGSVSKSGESTDADDPKGLIYKEGYSDGYFTHCVDPEGVVEPVLVDVAKQRLATHLLLTMISHRELHLGQLEIIMSRLWTVDRHLLGQTLNIF